MSKCIDCLSEKVCRYNDGHNLYCKNDYVCPHFTDRSEWVHLPCVGDKFFYIGSYAHNGELAKEYSVMESQVSSYGKLIVYDLDGMDFSIEDIFYTKEEAEKALEEKK